MSKATDPFLTELELRLEENRKIASRGGVPPILRGLASYLGFHFFSVLLGLSFGITALLFSVFRSELLAISRGLFWL